MVLHLLGKKSWHVYSHDNVERVRRDEEAAAAREQAREQRMQEEDAARRLTILRGGQPPAPARRSSEPTAEERRPSARSDGQPRKRRRLRGEDDTDAEIRHARQDVEAGEHAKTSLARGTALDAPLLDHAGHLQLIPAPDEQATRRTGKHAEVEAEKAKKRKREEDQYMMRFSNAAGFHSGMQKPWYAASRVSTEHGAQSGVVALADVRSRDVWGNEDPRRKEREHSRISKSDPFAAMQQAQRQLKQSERDKTTWHRERAAEVEERMESEKRQRHRRRRRDSDSPDALRLDAPSPGNEKQRSDLDGRRRHIHAHRHPSHDRNRPSERKAKQSRRLE